MLVNFKIHQKESHSRVTPVQQSVNNRKLAKYSRSHASERETGGSANTGVAAVGGVRLCSQRRGCRFPPRSFLIEPGLVCQRCEEAEGEPFSGRLGEGGGCVC